MNERFVIDVMKVMVEHNLLSDTVLRNEKIRFEYKQLRKSGIKGKDARDQLAEQYCIGVKSIENILYGKKND